MESLQETFILEKLNTLIDNEKIDKGKKKFKSSKVCSYISMILNQAYPTGSDMKALFYLFDTLFISRTCKKVNEKGLYNLSKNINKCVKKMEHLPVKSKEGFIYITHFFCTDVQVVVKIPQNCKGITSKVREYFIGINAINKLRYLTPCFVYTLGAFLCPKPTKTGEILFEKSTKNNTAFVMYEKIPGDSVQTLLKNDRLDFKQFLIILIQLLLGLEVAQREVRFTHFDMHAENVMARTGTGDSSSVTHFDMNTYIIDNPEFIPVVIDFGAATSYIDGKYIGSYDYISHGMLNFMVPGHDMYKFMIYCARKTTNKKLKRSIMSIFRFYEGEDPYFIARDQEKGLDIAAKEYCRELTFSTAANRTPLMLVDWLLKEYQNELSEKVIVRDRKNYIITQYSTITKEFDNIFGFTRMTDGKDKPEEAILLVKKLIRTNMSYVMSLYGIIMLEKYNVFLESEELESKIIFLREELFESKDELLKADESVLEKVFDINIPRQEDLDSCVNKLLKIRIRHSNAKEKEEIVTNLESILFYQESLIPFLQFYFTILELDDDNLDNWIDRFKFSDIYHFYVKNVSQNERAKRWGQTLLASII
jgi:serine/threonine protein kinase